MQLLRKPRFLTLVVTQNVSIYESARVKIVGCIVVNLPAIIFNNCLENKLS